MSAVADLVEVAAHPAGPEVGVGRADLPVVARGEVRLVGMVVADRRQDGHLPLARGAARAARATDARRAGVSSVNAWPPESARLGRSLRVERVACRVEHRHPVGAARQEDRDEDRGRRGRPRRSRSPRRRGPGARAVDGQREPDRAGDEAAPRHPRPGRERHAGLDRAQALAGDGAARELVAAAARHAVWRSGETAISWRSAFSIRTG